MLTTAEGHHAPGLLLNDLDAAARDRIDYYEAPYGYVRSPVSVTVNDSSIDAEAYLPPDSMWTVSYTHLTLPTKRIV